MRQQELCDEEQLPDRLVNPCEYQQLPQNRDNDEDGSENLIITNYWCID